MRRARVAGWGLAVLAAAVTPALATFTRPVTLLDGDAAVRALSSEDLLFTQQPAGGATTEFGSAVAFGDVDGDGRLDALVGQRTENKVFIFMGRAVPRAAAYFDDPNQADIVLTAPAGTSDHIQQLGFSVAAADLDGDGKDDVVVGAPFSDPSGRVDQGLAFVVLGRGDLVPRDPADPLLTIDVTAPAGNVEVVKLTRGAAGKAGDLLGFSVTGALSGAGGAWLVVSARGADATTPSLRADAGAVHVAHVAFPAPAPPLLDLNVQSSLTLFGEDASDALGEWVSACDVDNAGEPDVLAGAIFSDGPGNTGLNRGEALLVLGENVASGQLSGPISAAWADLRIHGATNGDDFGYTVACGDLNGDQRAEILSGALFADAAGDLRPSAGEVSVLRGRASQLVNGRRELIDPATGQPQGLINLAVSPPDLLLQGATTGDQLGFSVAVGDLDDDGFGDLIAGARLYDRAAATPNTGAVYLLRGGALLPPAGGARVIDLRQGTVRDVLPGYVPGTPVIHLPNQVDGIVVGASAEDNAGFTVAAGDLDDNGGDELLVSAIGDLARAPGFRGEAYVVSFQDHDADEASDFIDQDNDNDGLRDAEEDIDGDGILDDGETDPLDPDTDQDQIQDGTECGVACRGQGGPREIDCDDPSHPFTSTAASLALHFVPDEDPNTVTNARDRDSDDDGLSDGSEDVGHDGFADQGESDPSRHDTDNDLVFDGTESGRTTPVSPTSVAAGTDVNAGHWKPDADAGVSVTDPSDADTDDDGLTDGVEDSAVGGERDGALEGDADHDGQVDPGEVWSETDPRDDDTDRDGIRDGVEDANHNGQFEKETAPGLEDLETDPLDQDTDDDGLADGWIDGSNGAPLDGIRNAVEYEDGNGDGDLDFNESSARRHDTDRDGLTDGVESGLSVLDLPGRDGMDDTGPGQGATDPLAGHLKIDGDAGATFTDPADADDDDDGLPDGFIDGFNPNSGGAPGGLLNGVPSEHEGEDLNGNGVIDPGETNPEFRDTDNDGVKDGAERGVLAPGVLGPDGVADPNSAVKDGTRGGLATEFDTQDSTLTDALDADTDDDGLSDGAEDTSGNGAVGTGESDPLIHDSDGDQLFDGLEAGRVDGVLGGYTNMAAGHFMADADSATTTSPARADTDAGGVDDGDEDADHNGRLDAGERDPNLRADDDRTGALLPTDDAGAPLASLVPGQTFFLRLDDETDANLDPNVAETFLGVICLSSPTSDQESIALLAIAPDSPVFTAFVNTLDGVSNSGDGILQVSAGGQVTCTYTDPQDPVDIRVATIPVVTSVAAMLPAWDLTMQPGGRLVWQAVAGASIPAGTRFNVYRGDLLTLRQTHVYTQQAAACALDRMDLDDPVTPASGAVVYYLVAGVLGGVEGPLGTDSAGAPHSSTELCAP